MGILHIKADWYGLGVLLNWTGIINDKVDNPTRWDNPTLNTINSVVLVFFYI